MNAADSNERWNTMLEGINEISRLFSSRLDGEALWDELHDQINVLFDTSSFFVALYDAEHDRLELPLVSEEGMRVRHEPIPLTGFSRALLAHGIEMYFRDIEAEAERLAALKIEANELEPGIGARSWLGVPLRTRQNELVGLIAVQNTLPAVFGDHDLALLMTIAAQMSLALDNMRLADQERARRQVVSALMEISQVVSERSDAEDVLERVLDQLQRVVSYESASILLASGDGTRMALASTTDLDLLMKGSEFPFTEQSIVRQVVLSQQPAVLDDADMTTMRVHGLSRLPGAGDLRSWIIAPMVVQERVTGVILLGRLAASAYTQKDASTVFAIARQAGIAIENSRLHTQAQMAVSILEQRARRLTSIHRITSVIASSLDRDEVLNTTAQLLTELFAVDHCGILMINEESKEAVLVTEYPSSGNLGLSVALDAFISSMRMFQYGTAVAIEDVETSDIDETTRGLMRTIGARSVLLAPLVARDRILGSIGLDVLSQQRAFSAEDRETIMTVAGQVAMAISNAELYQQALEANRLKSEFLTNISHELRTPLNAINGYSNMMLEGFYGELTEQQRDRLTRVSTGGLRLLELINDVLDLSRIEAGQVTLSLIPMRLSDIVRKVIDEALPRAHAKNLPIDLRIPDEEPRARADGHYLHEVFAKLLDNAIKFTHSGHIQVEIVPTAVQQGAVIRGVTPPGHLHIQNGDWVAVVIADTGIGIRPEDREIIFDTFRQVDGSTVRQYGGVGLGLAITRQLVQLHEGHLWVDGAPGKGSKFTVLVPGAPLSDLEVPIPEITRDGRPLVLVIDDEDESRQLIEDYLSDEPYQVLGIGAPAHALQIARQLHPDVVISDVMMPTMNGWDVLRALKDDVETASIPVIILSIIDQKAQGFYLGAADYLVKPVMRRTLLDSLERVLRQRRRDPLLIISDSSTARAHLLDALSAYPTAAVDSAAAALAWLHTQSTSGLVIQMRETAAVFDLLASLRASPFTASLSLVVITADDTDDEMLRLLRERRARVLRADEAHGALLLEQIGALMATR